MFFFKKTQISLYVIFVLIMLMIIFLFFKSINPEDSLSFEEDNPLKNMDYSGSVHSFVEECLKTTSKRGIRSLFVHGGIFQPEQNYTLTSELKIPHYYGNREILVPSKEIMQNELSLFIENELDSCLDNFTMFKDSGLYLNSNDKMVSVLFGESTNIWLLYPIDVLLDNRIVINPDYFVSIDFNFHKINGFIAEILDEQIKTPDSLPIGFIVDIASNNDFYFETMYFGYNETLITLIFNETSLSKPLFYNFILKYNWSDIYGSK